MVAHAAQVAAPWKRTLQNLGIALPSEHIAHHKLFDKHYCILTGDSTQCSTRAGALWRRLEGLVYACNGQEPLSWKDERVKQQALRTWPGGALP